MTDDRPAEYADWGADLTAEGVLSAAEREVTPRSILSWCLVGARPYDEAQRILDKLEGAGWTVTRLAARAAADDEEAAAVRAENVRLREQVAAVRAVLDGPGRHAPDCALRDAADAACSCWRGQIATALDAPTTAPPEQGGAS